MQGHNQRSKPACGHAAPSALNGAAVLPLLPKQGYWSWGVGCFALPTVGGTEAGAPVPAQEAASTRSPAATPRCTRCRRQPTRHSRAAPWRTHCACRSRCTPCRPGADGAWPAKEELGCFAAWLPPAGPSMLWQPLPCCMCHAAGWSALLPAPSQVHQCRQQYHQPSRT